MQPYNPDLHKVSVGLKSFLRDDKLFRSIASIRQTLPEVEIVIADDGRPSSIKDGLFTKLVLEGHKVRILDFDSGFGAKSNSISRNFTREYLLVGSDDFDFSPLSVRSGIEKLVDVLDSTGIDIASGRVRGPYEFLLEESEQGQVIRERALRDTSFYGAIPWYVECDLTVNYSLIKQRVFDGRISWDDEVKIGGGEHGAFFLDVKRAGYKVAWVPGVSIQEFPEPDSEEYKMFRGRAMSPDRPCFVKRGIRKYILANGRVDWVAPNSEEPLTR